MADVVAVTCLVIGFFIGRNTIAWEGWDVIAKPLQWLWSFTSFVASIYLWLIGGFLAIATSTMGEMLSEVILDRYRVDKQYPLWHNRTLS